MSAHRRCAWIVARTHRVMRAKLKLNVIKQARTVKNKNMQRQPKIPVKVHRYPKGKPLEN
jgi:hypothetical protein